MKVVFLDRDGVINKYPGDKEYVTSLAKFKFLPRAKEAIRLLHQNKIKLFVASNQAGVGKGTYSQRTLDKITEYMLKKIRESNGDLDGVYYCTHRKELNCSCRKPKPGLVNIIKKENKINLKCAYFVGDTIRDVETAKAAGCKSILVFSGKEKPSESRNWESKPDFVFKDLFEAAKFILRKK